MDDALARLALVTAVAATVVAHADELTALDQAIGDGDHGINLKRGFDAVLADARATCEKPWPDLLKAVGMTLVMKVGGASGPLLGTLFMELGKALPPDPSRGDLSRRAPRRSRPSRRGESPSLARRPCSTCSSPCRPPSPPAPTGAAVKRVAADAAPRRPCPMRAMRGRASFLGDRSIGHIDPGARSASLMIAAVVDGWRPSRRASRSREWPTSASSSSLTRRRSPRARPTWCARWSATSVPLAWAGGDPAGASAPTSRRSWRRSSAPGRPDGVAVLVDLGGAETNARWPSRCCRTRPARSRHGLQRADRRGSGHRGHRGLGRLAARGGASARPRS